MCTANLDDGPLTCIRTTPHEPHKGCVFEASSGADLSKEGVGDE